MDVGLVIKIFGLGVVGVIADITLKKAGKQDIAFIMDIIVVLLAFGMCIFKINTMFKDIMAMFGV